MVYPILYHHVYIPSILLNSIIYVGSIPILSASRPLLAPGSSSKINTVVNSNPRDLITLDANVVQFEYVDSLTRESGTGPVQYGNGVVAAQNDGAGDEMDYEEDEPGHANGAAYAHHHG